MHTYHIHISGVVQGVGFRPFVYNLAIEYGIKGWVMNGMDGVRVQFNADTKQVELFYSDLLKRAPSNARIYNHTFTEVTKKDYETFSIIRSDESGNPNIPLTPDYALCPTCRKELKNSDNRRYQYPFTTCIYCGPRYSITKKLPYDRHTTTMHPFSMCSTCQYEYNDPLDRRYYSQTNSCETCGIELQLVNLADKQFKKLTQLQIIVQTSDYLHEGQILAIKGIGGYLLVCDANNHDTINQLRERKHRPTKPFAVMYPSIESLQKEFSINSSEEEALSNEVASIVLLRKRKDTSPSIDTAYIAPKLNRIGCMIPYAPLFELILRQFGKPIVATSGNISGSPIIYNDTTAKEELASIADIIISNNREIEIPQDDSVLGFTTQNNLRIVHRRSRGLAPNYLETNTITSDKTILSVGAQLKSSVAVHSRGRTYISQYLGNTDNYLTQEAYNHTVAHLQSVLNCSPEVIVADKHPNYFSTTWGEQKAAENNISIHHVQHHEAHFWSVLSDNNLIDSREKIMGIIWDGTGFGDDGNIWGGEFFFYQNKKIEHLANIGSFPFILGDKMPHEPRISALCITSLSEDYSDFTNSKFSSEEWGIYQRLLTDNNNLQTSGMGRLFDAVACILLKIDKISYEGEAAILLECLAEQHSIQQTKTSIDDSFFTKIGLFPDNPALFLVENIIVALNEGISIGEIAYFFHISLVDLIRRVAQKNKIKHLAFSGGVFQNMLLTDLIITHLKNDFMLHFHKQLSPNDENISLGQLVQFITLQETLQL